MLQLPDEERLRMVLRGLQVQGCASCHAKGKWGWALAFPPKKNISLTKRGLSR